MFTIYSEFYKVFDYSNLSKSTIQCLYKNRNVILIKSIDFYCKFCRFAKFVKKYLYLLLERQFIQLFEYIRFDLLSKFSVKLLKDFQYFILFINNYIQFY